MIVVIFDFNACSVTASIKIFVFIFAERRCVFGMVGAVPACPPERPHSGVSIPKIYALYAGDERWMRPCRATRAGTQRRFHTKNTRIVHGKFNDGCAPAGRHGRAHRHRPYQSPLYIRVQSSSTTSTTQTKRVNNPHNTLGGGNASRTPAPIL